MESSCCGYFPLWLLYFPVVGTFWRSNQTSPKLVPLRLLLELTSNWPAEEGSIDLLVCGYLYVVKSMNGFT